MQRSVWHIRNCNNALPSGSPSEGFAEDRPKGWTASSSPSPLARICCKARRCLPQSRVTVAISTSGSSSQEASCPVHSRSSSSRLITSLEPLSIALMLSVGSVRTCPSFTEKSPAAVGGVSRYLRARPPPSRDQLSRLSIVRIRMGSITLQSQWSPPRGLVVPSPAGFESVARHP
jgi:hypothetical protein